MRGTKFSVRRVSASDSTNAFGSAGLKVDDDVNTSGGVVWCGRSQMNFRGSIRTNARPCKTRDALRRPWRIDPRLSEVRRPRENPSDMLG